MCEAVTIALKRRASPLTQRKRPNQLRMPHSFQRGHREMAPSIPQYSLQYSIQQTPIIAWYAREWLRRKLSKERVSERKAAVSRYSPKWNDARSIM